MNRTEWIRTLTVLITFSVAFIVLTVSSYVQKSGTSDEASHLTAGYAALTLGDYRIDPEHPPLVRMWAALPLLFTSDIAFNTNCPSWKTRSFWEFSHDFVYGQNDADRLLYRGRFMIVLLGVLLGWLVFFWSRELFGFWPAVIVLGLYATEPNILAHSSLVTTDLGISCFFFGTIYFLWRTSRELSVHNLLGLVGFCALAQVTKFSALLLVPIVLLLLLIRVCRSDAWVSRIGRVQEYSLRIRKVGVAFVLLLVLAAGSYLTIWGITGFRYCPAPTSVDPNPLMRTKPRVTEFVPRLSTMINWIDQHQLLPNIYSQGFLLGQGKAQRRPSFLMGQFSATGWWYYFPTAFLFKTSVTILLLFAAAMALCAISHRTLFENEAFFLIPIAVYLGTAMTTNINIGLRHILPIYPFVLLACGKSISALQSRMPPRLLLFLLVIPALELATVYPHCLAFFNQLAGGPRNGHTLLTDSNIDWGQDLKGLRRWMEKNHVRHINLSYFGTADPAYYKISCTYLPGSPFFAKNRVEGPWVPGYVAVSVNQFHDPSDESVRNMYSPLLQRQPAAVIGYSIHVYWVDGKWW
jgi:hypothetical protein